MWAPAQALPQEPRQAPGWASAQAQRWAPVQVLCREARPAATLRQRWVLARALRPGRAPARECSQVKEQAPPRSELERGCLCLALALQGHDRGSLEFKLHQVHKAPAEG